MDLATILVDEQTLSQEQKIAYKNAAEAAAEQTHDTTGTPSQYVVKTYQELGNSWKGALFNPATPARAIANTRELDQYILDKTGFSYDNEEEEYEKMYRRILNNGLFIVRTDLLRGGITRKKRKQRKQKRTKKAKSTRRR